MKTDTSSDKPTLVLLHGFLGKAEDWAQLLPNLSHHFNCITIDLPGHGKNCYRNFDTIEAIVQALDIQISQLTKAPIHLLGYSLGGRLAIAYAQTFPEKILSLSLISCHLGLKEEQARASRLSRDLKWAKRFSQDAIDLALYAWYEQEMFNDLSEEAKLDLIRARCDNHGVSLSQTLIASSLAKQPRFHEFLANFNKPCHYYYGRNDDKYCHLVGEYSQIPSMQIMGFDCGHSLHSQLPDLLSKSIVQQLTVQKLAAS